MARMEWLEYIGNKMIQGRETLKFIKGSDVFARTRPETTDI